jgi:small subunit ribosomal protein S24e
LPTSSSVSKSAGRGYRPKEGVKMELEIVSKKENPLLDRTELEVLAHHAGKPTPTRDEMRQQVAAAMKAKKDVVLVDHMESSFGRGLTRGYVKVYKNKEAAKAIERGPIKRRNALEKAAPVPTKEKAKAPEVEPEPEPETEEKPGAEEKPEAEEKPGAAPKADGPEEPEGSKE